MYYPDRWTMRGLFSFVIVLGLLLIVLSICELYVVGVYREGLRDADEFIAVWEKNRQEEANRRHMVITGTSLAGSFKANFGNFDSLWWGWFAGAIIGGAATATGIAGLIRTWRTSPDGEVRLHQASVNAP